MDALEQHHKAVNDRLHIDIKRLQVVNKELLESLKGMVDYYGTASARVEQLDSARAAIAKATGEKE